MDSSLSQDHEQLNKMSEEAMVRAFVTLTLRDFVGFETGGLEEVEVVLGTPTVKLGIIP